MARGRNRRCTDGRGRSLPWIDGDSLATVLSLAGHRFGEGVLTLVFGCLGLVLIGLALIRGSGPGWFPLLAAILAFCGLLTVLYFAATEAAYLESVGWNLAINGVGLYVSGIGAILAAITGVARSGAQARLFRRLISGRSRSPAGLRDSRLARRPWQRPAHVRPNAGMRRERATTGVSPRRRGK